MVDVEPARVVEAGVWDVVAEREATDRGQARVGSAFVPVAEPRPRTRQAHRVPALNAPVVAPL